MNRHVGRICRAGFDDPPTRRRHGALCATPPHKAKGSWGHGNLRSPVHTSDFHGSATKSPNLLFGVLPAFLETVPFPTPREMARKPCPFPVEGNPGLALKSIQPFVCPEVCLQIVDPPNMTGFSLVSLKTSPKRVPSKQTPILAVSPALAAKKGCFKSGSDLQHAPKPMFDSGTREPDPRKPDRMGRSRDKETTKTTDPCQKTTQVRHTDAFQVQRARYGIIRKAPNVLDMGCGLLFSASLWWKAGTFSWKQIPGVSMTLWK